MDNTIANLQFLSNHTKITFSYFTKSDVTPLQFVCLCMLERLHASCEGLLPLISGVEKNIYLEYSAGLIIRTELLDLLTALRAYDVCIQLQEEGATKSKDEIEKDITQCCNEILAEGLNVSFGYVKDLNEANFITDEQLEEVYRHLPKKYPQYIEEYKDDGQKPKLKYSAKIGGKMLFKHLSQKPFLQDLSKVYYHYLYYSRYEHFGVQSQEVLREDQSEKLSKLHKSIYRLTVLNYVLCDMLAIHSSKDKVVLNQCEIAGRYVKENRLDKT